MKSLIYGITVAGAIFAMASCSKSSVDTAPAMEEIAARKNLTVAEGYIHGNVYGADTTYKVTTTLLSQGMKFAYSGYTYSASGNGYVLEIEFNSTDSSCIAEGIYKADSLVEVTSSGNVWAHDSLTYNPDNTSLTYQSGNSTSYTIKDATFEVSKKDGNYVIKAKVKTVTGIDLELNFSGKIEFNDVFFYLQPAEKADTTTITFNANTATVEASSSNKDDWSKAISQCTDTSPTNDVELTFTTTLTGENGETVVLDMRNKVTVTKDTEMSEFPESPITGTYSYLSAVACCYSGYWNVLNSKGTAYDTSTSFRSKTPTGSFIIAKDGVMYYIGDGILTDKIEASFDAKGNVVSIDGVLTSANGTAIKIKTAAPAN